MTRSQSGRAAFQQIINKDWQEPMNEKVEQVHVGKASHLSAMAILDQQLRHEDGHMDEEFEALLGHAAQRAPQILPKLSKLPAE